MVGQPRGLDQGDCSRMLCGICSQFPLSCASNEVIDGIQQFEPGLIRDQVCFVGQVIRLIRDEISALAAQLHPFRALGSSPVVGWADADPALEGVGEAEGALEANFGSDGFHFIRGGGEQMPRLLKAEKSHVLHG